jgi:predicted RNase H-like nuclease (RuvC/YqgF family)
MTSPILTLQSHINTLNLEKSQLEYELLHEDVPQNIRQFRQGIEDLEREISDHKRAIKILEEKC